MSKTKNKNKTTKVVKNRINLAKLPKKTIDFFVTNKKILIWVIIALLTLFIILSITNLTVNIRFLTFDDLILDISPLQKTSKINNNDTVHLEFKFSNKNIMLCNTVCEFTLKDTYTGKIISNKTKVLNSNQEITEIYDFKLNNKGKGEQIYYFEAACNNIKSFICKTDETTKLRSSIVNIKYNYTEKEITKIKNLEKNIISKHEMLFNAKKQEDILISIYDSIKKNIPVKTTFTTDIDSSLKKLNKSILYFYSQDFDSSLLTLNEITFLDYSHKINEINNSIKKYNKNLNFLTLLEDEKYNSAYDYYTKINSTKSNKLKFLYEIVYSKNLSYFEDIVTFNVETIYNRTNLLIQNYSNEKNNTETKYWDKIKHDYATLNSSSLSLTGDLCTDMLNINIKISETNNQNLSYFDYDYCNTTHQLHNGSIIKYEKIFIVYKTIEYDNLKLDNPKDQCCIFESCESCESSYVSYPIIFVHGHSFNKENPPESSINTFADMQKKLSDEQVMINGGDIDYSSLNEPYWSRNDIPIGIKVTYYYIPYFDTEIIAKSIRKEEGIESYSIRLKELIDLVLEKTGADKVRIVAHSMGGLVTRNYMYLFGENKVDKVILIGTPNNGISGRVKDLCSYLGDKKACKDMSEDSIFMKRLSSYTPKTEIITIIGTGCDTDGKDGDGVVTKKSSQLDYAKNIFINGSCNDFLNTELHSDLKDPLKYPEVYELVKENIIE